MNNLIILANHQNTRELSLFCENCLNGWLDYVPKSFKLDRYPCHVCGCRGTLRAKLERHGA